ncbi:DUF4178 domain-containing protein [Hymenobacter sp. GOD-10R]|uniref:DUF4178 domain-containing protein n=1 Tax=Hymenobacter sp. GOD-10R TaxID=3093922 RepID=UPI002D79AA81|nr:DUF4178 domain-containing protein [Hymenobacter sp. GOD-10R]WRQ26821.1 DUF4178 domain-containing protein [Hymenobacter sp. GOD-10R]
MSEVLTNPPSAELQCPHCGTTITYYDVQGSSFYACPHCHWFFEHEGESRPKLLYQFQDVPRIGPPLPLGSKGVLHGEEYRIVGFMVRKEARTPARWAEYMLFHSKTASYAQLSVFEGHWMFIKPAERSYKVNQADSRRAYVEAEDDTYMLYNRYSPRVLFAIGEFDWNIREDEELSVHEFVAAPYMLVEERKPNKLIDWYKAEHMKAEQVALAFGVDKYALPDPIGVGAIEPAPGQKTWPTLRNFTLFLALIVVATQLLLLGLKPERQVLSQQFHSRLDASLPATATAGGEAVIVSTSFQVDGPAAISVQLRSALDNQWLELPVSVINEKTGQSYEFSKALEYYHGYEGGESWSEGSQEQEATLGKIPTGRYHLNIYPTSEVGLDLPIYLTVSQQSSLHSNAILLLLALLIYPGIQYWRRSYHEQQRWENSDYGPTT